MVSVAPKTNKNITAVPQKTAGTTFFRKAGETSFFGSKETHTFFGKPIQAKLTVSSPDDPQEKEADAVADKVMRMPEPVLLPASPLPVKENKIERKEEEELYPKLEPSLLNKVSCKEDNEERLHTKSNIAVYKKDDEHLDLKMRTASGIAGDRTINRKNISLHRSDVIQCSGRGPPQPSIPFQQNLSSSKGSGSKLPADTRTFMESRFNADFDNVRVHTGAGAEQMSNQVHAKAFTHGNDIYFNQGKYAPDSSGGRLLLAHELTHTIQQGASPVDTTVSRKYIHRAASKRGPLNPSLAGAISTSPTTAKESNALNRYAGASDLVQTSPDSITSGGSSLSSEAQEYFQDSFKTDVGDIRVHVDFQSALLTRSRGVPAFVEGRHILFDPSRYSPDSEEGGILLSKQIAESLKQRSINVPGLASQLNQGINQAKTGASVSKPKQAKPDQKNLLISKDKKKAPLKGKDAKGGKGKKGKLKKKSGSDKSDAFTGKAVKPNPKKSPSSPEEDPAFHKVVKKASARAKDQKKHDDPVEKAEHAQKAAKAVPDEAQSAAKKRKTEGMEEVAKEDKPFDDESFKADLLKKIEEVTPKNLEQATEFKENNKISEVKSAMGQKVASEKEKTAGPVEKVTQQPLQVNEADNKKPLPLPPTPKGSPPQGIGAQDAAPKPKLDAEISMEEQSKSLDTEMKSNNVTEEQLAKSNEPTFTTALKEKKGAQKDAKEKPLEFRKNEAQELKAAQASSNADASRAMSSMHATRGKEFDGTVKQQQKSKSKDEEERAAVVAKIQSMYQQTETVVTALLTVAETTANSIFDAGSERARVDFENYVDREMTAYKRRRYSGFWGGLRWAKDKLFGMPDGVNKFYKEGRQRYLNQMDNVITQVAHVITTNLNAAKQAIKNGKKQITDYVSGLEGSLKNVGAEAAESIQDKFDTLEQTVNDKREQLVDGLARKYVANLKKLDDRITELKEANKGLIAKAIGLLKEIWKVIKNLYELFKTILQRIISVIGLIIDDPGKFFDNLGAAFKQGFDRFTNRIGEHLENGLMAWVSSQLGVADIKLPEKFDISAIFGLVLQVLGLTYENIRERAVILIGEERVLLLEQTVETGADIFQRIKKGGLGAVWDMIKEKLTDFKDMIWEAIKTFIKDAVVKAAITFILSLLNPVAAFVKACMAIYQFIMMLVRMKDRIIDLLNSILDAVAMIASGAVDKAAGFVEMAFAKSIPIIIGFLAALLGLNDIGSKVKGIILRIREKVNKVIDWVLTKAYSIVRPVVEAAMRVKNKGKELYEKGKEKGKALIEKGKEKVRGALGAGDTPQERLENGLQAAQKAVNKYAGKRVGPLVLRPILGAIKLKYGFQVLEVVARGQNWAVAGKINPDGELMTEANIEDGTETSEVVDKEFKIGDEAHIIKGEIINDKVRITMASGLFAELNMRLNDIERFHVEKFKREGATEKAQSLHNELERIAGHIVPVIQRIETTTGREAKNRLMRNAVDGLSADLAGICRRFGITRILEADANYTVPEHSVTYSELNSDGQADRADGILSWKTREHMRGTETSGVNMGGMNLVPGYHRGHLLAASLGGSNTDLRNFTPMSETTNTSRGGMVTHEKAARDALKTDAYPPYILRYSLKCHYANSKDKFQSWLKNNFSADSKAADNLYRLARSNEDLSPVLIFNNLGGAASMAEVSARYNDIVEKLKMHYMPSAFTMAIYVDQGHDLKMPNATRFNNHQ